MSAPAAGRKMRVALAQVDCALGDVEENARRAREAIVRARESRADLLVFPELSLAGYSLAGVNGAALEPDSALIAGLAEEAGEMAVVLGFVEKEAERFHNSAAYLEAGRALHVQRKTFLPGYGRFEEDRRFAPGDGVHAFATRGTRLALLICNDLWQAPLVFMAVHDGAELLIVPACSGVVVGGTDDSHFRSDWDALLRFHARFHQAFVVFVNRVGGEGEVRFWGSSRVLDPLGRVVAEAPADEPALVIAELDLSEVRRRREELPLLEQPRLELLAREFNRLAGGQR